MTETSKEAFIASYKAVTGKELSKDTDPKEFARVLNGNKPLRQSFTSLFPKDERNEEENVSAGMAGLFG